ncbi:DUF883 family protein [Hyphococcus sp.]|jgi:ElaB/YqjD/DUF883 family membrane-anchored ribosome-binding protein|uniref:DUF883 family protein n=1 Tax=Hyphococcus sp. TaxID=2038636 RepID=UPI003D0E80D1
MYGDKAMSATKKLAEGASDADLRQDIEALRNDLKALRDDVLAIGAKKATDATETLDEQINKMRDRATKLMNAADEESRHAASAIEKNVKENPVASLSAAVALGFLLGRTFLRK